MERLDPTAPKLDGIRIGTPRNVAEEDGMSRRFAWLVRIGAMVLPTGASAQVPTLASANPAAVAMAPLGADAFPWGAVDHRDGGGGHGGEGSPVVRP